ncbi:hypothetical protein MMC08_004788 [Hypocenomyce scalaris]|nr:hypothetical protein [Hypocenomyce scalaris]
MSFHSGIAYHDVPNGEKNTDVNLKDVVEARPNRSSLRKIVFLIVIAIVTTFATVFSAVGAAIAREAQYKSGNHGQSTTINAAVSIPDQSKLSQTPRYESCGHSPVEARSRGCNFDIISFAWLMPECYNDSLTQEFISWSNWTWYTSEEPEDNTQLSFEVAKLGEEDTFVDWNYHMVHCTFMWRQQHAATENGWVGRHLVHYAHTVHCQHSLLQDAYENRNVRTPARVVYPPCLKVGMGEGMYPGPASRAGIHW